MTGVGMRRFATVGLWIAVLVCGLPAGVAHASLVGGVTDLVQGVFALPMGILGGTISGPPIIGTINGLLHGTFATVGYTARGLMQLTGAAIPAASTLAPFLPFVL